MRAVPAQRPAVVFLLVIALGIASRSSASDLSVTITDHNDEALRDVAVYLLPTESTSTALFSAKLPGIATMKQIDNMFVPHMLVVQTGTQVEFPNNDTVSHHVYSFSQAKRFQLDLYRGNEHPPQSFDTSGLIVLGCNIHDSMLGYILVVDTPYSSVTTANGRAEFSMLPEGDYELIVWTPRAKPEDLPLPRAVSIDPGGNLSLTVKLTGRLNPPHNMAAGSLTWERY